ncbi:MAG TPA: GNAT family N-acetyltransferase [Thermohalobaculum sp.]|nr:GNAT family N-acetyltransferase [Thermohalobaculum sp.]
MTAIPTIETERLTLRAPRLEDFEPFAAHMASPRSVWEDGPLDRARAWKEFASARALWDLRGYGSWSLADRARGDYLGEVGIYQPAHYPEPEIGWMVLAQAEGKGLAHEAALAVRGWAYDRRGLGALVSYIDPGNDRSIRLAERLGARLDEASPKPEGEVCVTYRHPGPEALQ